MKKSSTFVAKKVVQKAPPASTVKAVKPVRKAAADSATGLSQAQIKELRIRLLELKKELSQSILNKAGSVHSSQYSESIIKGDDAEVAEKQRASNATLQELDILKHRLILVSRALSKIENGNFGVCEETDEPIGYERLSVVPWARYCVLVQERRERKLRDYKTSRLRSEF